MIMPSKLYGLLAVEKPIICVSDPKSEVVEILNQARAGVHSSIDDPKELAQKIVAILDGSEKAKDRKIKEFRNLDPQITQIKNKWGKMGDGIFWSGLRGRRLRGNGQKCWNDKDRGQRSEVGRQKSV